MSKRAKAARREVNMQKLIPHMEKVGADMVELTPYQFRIGKVLDYYPTSNKVFDLRRKRWGRIKEMREIEDILNDPFYL